jgi:hypothetical protein
MQIDVSFENTILLPDGSSEKCISCISVSCWYLPPENLAKAAISSGERLFMNPRSIHGVMQAVSDFSLMLLDKNIN